MAGGDGKLANVATGPATQNAHKNTVKQPPPMLLWVKIADTTIGGDFDYSALDKGTGMPGHVPVSQIRSELEKRFQWLLNRKVTVKVEIGTFTAAQLEEKCPESRRQVLLTDVARIFDPKKEPYPEIDPFDPYTAIVARATWPKPGEKIFNEKNCKNLMIAMGALNMKPSKAMPAGYQFGTDLDKDLDVYPEAAALKTTDLGLTPPDSFASLVEFWKTDERDQARNAEWAKHPGEWEAQCSAHEIAHTFIPNAHEDGGDTLFPTIMHIPVHNPDYPLPAYDQTVYDRTVVLDEVALYTEGGPDGAKQKFDALSNHRDSKWSTAADGSRLLILHYVGFPGFSQAQQQAIFEAIRARRDLYS